MNFLPKSKLTWVVLVILLYAYATSASRSPESAIGQDLQPKTSISVKAGDKTAPFFEKPAQFIFDKLSQTETGSTVVKALVDDAVRKQYGESDLTVVSAKHTNQISSVDIVRGTGATAHCGSTVTVQYDTTLSNKITIFSTKAQPSPPTVTLGKGQIVTGLEQGIVGMNVGGTRKIAVPPKLAYDDPRFTNSMVPKGEVVIFQVELVDVKGGDTNAAGMVQLIEEKESQNLQTAMCGSNVEITYLLTDPYGKPVSDAHKTPESLSYVVGKSAVPEGFVQAVQNMHVGGTRKVMIPPALLAMPANSILPNDLSWPKNKPLVLELTLVGIK